MRFLDRPYFLAGTAIPDWLSVVDRRVRMRSRYVEPFLDDADEVTSELAAGVLQHLDDDGWFHRTPAFYETTSELADLIREVLGPEDGFRPGFLGHIVTELLLDGVLIAKDPSVLDAYYDVLEQLDPQRVQDAVNQMARGTTERLVQLIPRFHREQFLRDYHESERLLFRLNQVMRRVKLKPLPAELVPALEKGRALVESRVEGLLPEKHFSGGQQSAFSDQRDDM